jgi:hypothetical protein
VLTIVDALPDAYREGWAQRFEEQKKTAPAAADIRTFDQCVVRDALWKWKDVLPPERRKAVEEQATAFCGAGATTQLCAPGSVATADTGAETQGAARSLRVLRRSGVEGRVRLVVGPSGHPVTGVARRRSGSHPLIAFSYGDPVEDGVKLGRGPSNIMGAILIFEWAMLLGPHPAVIKLDEPATL